MNSDNLHCDISSQRAIKARVGSWLEKSSIRNLMTLVIFLSLLTLLWLIIIQQNAVGWLLLIPIGILSVFLIWYHGDLNELSPASSLDNVRDLSDVMSRNLLSKITKDQTKMTREENTAQKKTK